VAIDSVDTNRCSFISAGNCTPETDFDAPPGRAGRDPMK
jgi:hypothetical protein